MTMFSQPEEKLWLVVKSYTGVIDEIPSMQFDNKRAIKLQKGSIIKMGRVRMRVRDIDYSDEAKPVQDLLSSPDKKTSSGGSSPGKRASSVTKLKEGKKDKAGKDAKKGKEMVKGKKSSESNPG